MGNEILSGIYSFLITIVGALYNLVATLFELFSMLSKVATVDKDIYGNVIDNFYLIIGVVMLFVIAFSMLKAMINPDDNKETGNGGKVVKNFVTSVVILLVLPTIFNFAFSFQFSIVDYGTIGRIFGYNNTVDSNSTMASAGNSMANSVFTAFFAPSRQECANRKLENDLKACGDEIKNEDNDSLNTVISEVNSTGYFGSYSSFGKNVANDEISFNFLVALIAGLYLLYVVFSFCLDLGLRLVKLVFYQIIAPIPVFLRVVPDGKLSNSFNEWIKITVTCYIEVFIRLFVIYFGVYLVAAFTSEQGLGNIIGTGNGVIGLIANVIIILGVITFIKQAPKLIGDIFGFDSSSMKLGLREKLGAGGLFATGAATGGAITSAVRGFTGSKKHGIRRVGSALGSGISGAGRGLKSGMGAKNFSEMKQAATKAASDVESKRQERELYSASKGGHVIKGRAEDALGTVKTWAGLNKVDEGEANRYDSAANAFDGAHATAEGVYKNKSDHNKLKEDVSRLKSEVTRRQDLLRQDLKKNEIDDSVLNEFMSLWDNRNSLKEGEEKQKFEGLKHTISFFDKDFISVLEQKDEADARKTVHEAAEMKKKLSVQMTAVNDFVNAKIKFADIAQDITKAGTDDSIYKKLKAVPGGDIKGLISKLENNELILESDLKDVDLNSLEKFLDQAGINAKNLAAEKKAAVAHEKALQDDKSSDGK